jgi:hypothetical protein
MAANHIYKPEVHWDQSEFETLCTGWSPERIKEDQKCLKKIFRQASSSPTLKAALDWAETHGIKFMIDYSATGVGGYYIPTTGVVAISSKYTGSSYDVEVLAHEIRHAWQDYHRLMPNSSQDFSSFYIQMALTEADAHAFGQRASNEFRRTQTEKTRKTPKNKAKLEFLLQTPLMNEDQDLREGFLSWFRWRAGSYGRYASTAHGRNLHDVLLEKHFEHTPAYVTTFPGPGVDLTCMDEVMKYGRGFSNPGNYLAGLQPDILLKKILRPSLADIFWGASNDDQRKLTTEKRKAHLRKKLAAALGKRVSP